MQHILLLICAWLLLLYCVVRVVGATRRKNYAEGMNLFTTTELPPMPMPICIDFSDEGCVPMLERALAIAEDTHHHIFMPVDAPDQDLSAPHSAIPCQHCGQVLTHMNHMSLTKKELLS